MGQLEAWQALAVSVEESVFCVETVQKRFTPKNDLPILLDYVANPGPDFWEKFPVNLQCETKSLIDADKLLRLAGNVGGVDADRLALVCGDLRDGADIGCRGAGRSGSHSPNAPSSYQFPRQVTDSIATWVKKKFVYGPVRKCDLPVGVKVNGIMCRPKPDGSVRIILNMSSPAGGSVNDGIDNSDFPAAMSSTKKWLAVLESAGRRCLIMKIDWSDAYKHICVRPEDLPLQWFSWLGVYFAELCLIFGTSSSVGIYDRCAKVVLEIVLRLSRFPAHLVCQHLDDVCAAGPAGSEMLTEFCDTYRKVAEQIGVRLAPVTDPDKAFLPCTSGTVLGVFTTLVPGPGAFQRRSWTACYFRLA